MPNGDQPNADPDVIMATKMRVCCPTRVFTATECFSALKNGADGLKFFPAFKLGLDGFNALKAVLPKRQIPMPWVVLVP